MKSSSEIMRHYKFSEATKRKVEKRKTEKGKILELSSEDAYKEAFFSDEVVFSKVFDARRINANDLCVCGCRISKMYKRIENTYKFRCRACRKIVSPLVDTALQGSHRSLATKMLFIFEAYTMRQGIAVTAIRKKLAWKYETCLNNQHRIMYWIGQAVFQEEFDPTLITESDECFVRQTVLPPYVSRSKGPSSEDKQAVHVLVQRKGAAKAIMIDYPNRANIEPIINQFCPPSSTIYTDGALFYNFLNSSTNNYKHEHCNHSEKQYSINGINVNVGESFNLQIKKQISRIHNGVTPEYFQSWLDLISWKFSMRYKTLYEAVENLFNALPPLNANIKKSKKNEAA